MNIELPENFTRINERGIKEVYIQDGILKIKHTVWFKALMRELTYRKKGIKICSYCGKKIQRKQMTIDHIIPQEIGGPTIINNLLPCCKSCNGEKANMTLKQYSNYLNKRTIVAKKEYLKKVQYQNEQLKSRSDFNFLNDWVLYVETSKIKMNREDIRWKNFKSKDFENSKKKNKYNMIKGFYHKYGRLKKAIIVDKNYHLLGGFTSLMFARKNHIKKIPVIVLENVEIFY